MIKEIIDYFEFEGNKIEVKSIIDESNKLTPIIFLHEWAWECFFMEIMAKKSLINLEAKRICIF